MSCKFSLPFTGTLSAPSPNNSFIACVTTGNRVTIRSTETLEISHIYQCVDRIDKIEISPDSCYVLCALYSRNVVQVFSVEDKEWKCRINEGVAGIVNAYWTPDSRNVITESDFGIQLSLWSLTEANSVIVALPKPPQGPFSKTLAFSDCGRFMAVVHRIELQDQIGVYTVASQTSLGMSEVSKFRARSNDVASVHWVPGGTHLITLDSPLTYKFCAYTPMGECLVQYEAYQNALGLRCLGLPRTSLAGSGSGSGVSADGKLLALGSFDGKLHLVSAYSWQLAFVLPLVHPRDLDAGFSGHSLLLTVECAASAPQSTLFGGSALTATKEGADGEDGEGEEAGRDGADGTDFAGEQVTTAPKQRQVPPHAQILRSAALIPPRRLQVPPNAQDAAEGVGQEQQREAHEREQEKVPKDDEGQPRSQMESYFALRSQKVLPRAQTYLSDSKRALASTFTGGRTVRKPAASTSATPSAAPTAPVITAVSATGYPAVGVSWVGWSRSGSLLAAREESHPRCVWVWRPLSAQLVALLVLLEPVTCAKWRPDTAGTAPARDAHSPPPPVAGGDVRATAPPQPPTAAAEGQGEDKQEERDVLALCTGNDKVYFWTAATGVTFAEVSALTAHGDAAEWGGQGRQHFTVVSLQWSRDGASLLLRGKEAHCYCRVALPALHRAAVPAK